MSKVVTGDAVELDVEIAQLPVRAVAALIDIFVMCICLFVGLMLAAFTLSQFDSDLVIAILIVFTVSTQIGYPVIFETTTRGRSLGKMAMGLRVVSEDGGPERARQAVFRALASVFEIWMLSGSPAVICSLVSSKGKRIGDIFAGTVVISERGPRLAPPPMMPPQLAGWASSLQLSGLGSDQAELARQFLSRAAQLDPRVRDQMAQRVAADVAARISPPPPPGTPPQFMLAAVLAERHRRELARMRAQAPAVAAQWGTAHQPAQWGTTHQPTQWTQAPQPTQWPQAPQSAQWATTHQPAQWAQTPAQWAQAPQPAQWAPAPAQSSPEPQPATSSPPAQPTAPDTGGFTPPN